MAVESRGEAVLMKTQLASEFAANMVAPSRNPESKNPAGAGFLGSPSSLSFAAEITMNNHFQPNILQ